MIKAGSYIKSTAALKGSFFEDAIILIIENNANGAEGFIVNKPLGRSLHELEEFRHSQPFPIFEGGPVDPEHIYILHSRPDLIEGGQPLSNGMYAGVSYLRWCLCKSYDKQKYFWSARYDGCDLWPVVQLLDSTKDRRCIRNQQRLG